MGRRAQRLLPRNTQTISFWFCSLFSIAVVFVSLVVLVVFVVFLSFAVFVVLAVPFVFAALVVRVVGTVLHLV